LLLAVIGELLRSSFSMPSTARAISLRCRFRERRRPPCRSVRSGPPRPSPVLARVDRSRSSFLRSSHQRGDPPLASPRAGYAVEAVAWRVASFVGIVCARNARSVPRLRRRPGHPLSLVTGSGQYRGPANMGRRTFHHQPAGVGACSRAPLPTIPRAPSAYFSPNNARHRLARIVHRHQSRVEPRISSTTSLRYPRSGSFSWRDRFLVHRSQNAGRSGPPASRAGRCDREHLAQRLMQQVRRRMMAGSRTSGVIDFSCSAFPV